MEIYNNNNNNKTVVIIIIIIITSPAELVHGLVALILLLRRVAPVGDGAHEPIMISISITIIITSVCVIVTNMISSCFTVTVIIAAIIIATNIIISMGMNPRSTEDWPNMRESSWLYPV